MAVYYVDPVNGNNANNGLGPDASHSTNKPWATIAKALGAAGISSGDTVYLAPGVYRETVTVAMTSAVAETKVLGDPQNSQGFKTAAGVRVDPGYVRWTAHTTSDITAPAGSPCLNLSGRDFLTFQNIAFFGGNATGSCVLATTLTSTDIKFQDCYFQEWRDNSFAINVTGGANAVLNWTISRCIVVSRNVGFFVTVTTSTTGSDWDINVLVEDCVFFQVGTTGAQIGIQTSGTNAVEGNGLRVRNCTLIGGGVSTTGTRLSLTYPTTVTNCLLWLSGTALSAGEAGAMTEDYNVIEATTLRTNVTAGTHSKDNIYCRMLELGQGHMWGLPFLRRMPFEPMAGSPLLGFGDDGSAPAYDLLNRPRPQGGASASKAVGALERGNTFATDPSPIGGGGSPIKVTGPATAEFLVPVPSGAARSISVLVEWDGTYTGTKPQFQIDANPSIGVSAETKTATGSANTPETLTLSNFTPTAAGLVRIRLLSNDTNGGGVTRADDFAVA